MNTERPKIERAHVGKRLSRWAAEWITTLRVAPPFSRRRRDLLETLRDDHPDNWIEVDEPLLHDECPCDHDHGFSEAPCEHCYWCQVEVVTPPGEASGV